ncbi:MAG: hypothetical protein MUF27_06975 [Acidobacteria bacterium]|jgi:hypothetical protein|nr:hypothetical protein [Acidobacteriota bacterium]
MASPPPAALRIPIELLDARMLVRTGCPELAALLRHDLGAFVVTESAASGEGWDGAAFDAGGDATASGPPPGQLFARVFEALLDRVAGFAVLHAAAVAHAGCAWLLAGPSGAGKTTLSLALLERGFPLLSDDFAPFELATGLVHPFPKSLGVREGPGYETAARLAERRGRAALRASDWEPAPLPLGGVLLFDGRDAAPAPRDPFLWRVACVADPGTLIDHLAALPGVALVARDGDEFMLTVDPVATDHAALASVLDAARDVVMEHGSGGTAPPAGRTALVVPIDPVRALFLLLREVQNRRPRGALMRRLGGDTGRLAAELGAATAGRRLGWLITGAPDATAEVAAGWIREQAGRAS